jgi:PAS domain S-box-containing protein
MDLSKLDRREPWKESFAAQAGSDALFELDAVGCFLIDDGGVIRRINRAAAKLLGDRTDSFVGERLAYFISRRSRPVLERHLGSVRRSGHTQRCDLRTWQVGQGTAHWLRLRSELVPTSTAHGQGVLSIAMPIDDLLSAGAETGDVLWDPVAPRGSGSVAPRRGGARGPAGGRVAKSRCRVLVVDDEELILKATVRLLKRIGYEAVSCRGAGEALRRVTENPHVWDAVVTDYLMPEMTGLQLCERLQELRPGLPVLMISGSLVEIDRRRLEDAGVARVLTKPVDVADFKAWLCELGG